MELLSIIYEFLVFLRNKLYDLNILKSKKVDGVKVICIGNIVAGGTGKTPAVQYFVKEYLKKNIKVGILSRGYKGKREKDLLLVRDEKKIFCTSKESGDEAFFHAENFEIPVVVSRDRYKGVKFLKENCGVKVVIMDDGFQHRKLLKDKNIVLIDATNPFGNEKYLPKGRLRESVDALNRADEIIITKSNYVGKNEILKILEKIKKYRKEIFFATFESDYLYKLNFEKDKKFGKINSESKKNEISKNIIKNKNILIFSSIANPAVFYKTIKDLEPQNLDEIKFSDHHLYSFEDFVEIQKKSKNYDFVVTTEKDAVKIEKEIENLLILKMKFELKSL
ncbi:tetraacyldisaccharide 4'-kinase [Leptotrichia sp. oral taxon 847]|uniref:tetraacyldisaccharide 4'-kinase n=1 Tax=Leptotrichia sp. oral taxon 847 TaxID=1785996 RepID=UPI000767F344|nr:tetraacyldisaccharide 4'-kinase [Leptotrichia sp. oral taxon 847]AMD95340.1 tetraacyldisaccharide 4'-kinase [Leptotrichia sp. oral taxon 847]